MIGWIFRQVLMQHLDGLEEVQQSHEFEIANLLAEAWWRHERFWFKDDTFITSIRP